MHRPDFFPVLAIALACCAATRAARTAIVRDQLDMAERAIAIADRFNRAEVVWFVHRFDERHVVFNRAIRDVTHGVKYLDGRDADS